MLKLLSRLIDRLARPPAVDFEDADPLLHPALRRMSQRELADLPFASARCATRCGA